MYQDVRARWVLRDLFLEVSFSSVKPGTDGNPDYEALYLMGYDQKEDKYILHLFDTYGVSAKPVPGIGVRDDDSIKFRFDYSIGLWLNVFTWKPEKRSWLNTITYQKDERTVIFAEKELLPVEG